jgi:endonuclease/exonuclease/phosphatase family metal-dependent hydrolase
VRTDTFAALGIDDDPLSFTSTATDAHQRIDGVFVDRSMTVRSGRVLDGADVQVASDHRPLLVELELPEAG